MEYRHPKLLVAAVKVMTEGAAVNLLLHSPYYGKFARKLYEVRHGHPLGNKRGLIYKLKLFGYDKFVAITNGAEAADTTMKILRKWGYMTKKVPERKCHILNGACLLT
jgi:ornithine--oxo-acid transaminase